MCDEILLGAQYQSAKATDDRGEKTSLIAKKSSADAKVCCMSFVYGIWNFFVFIYFVIKSFSFLYFVLTCTTLVRCVVFARRRCFHCEAQSTYRWLYLVRIEVHHPVSRTKLDQAVPEAILVQEEQALVEYTVMAMEIRLFG